MAKLFGLIFLMLIMTSSVYAEPIPRYDLNEKLKEKEHKRFSFKLASTNEYDAWLAKTQMRDNTDSCITNIAYIEGSDTGENKVDEALVDLDALRKEISDLEAQVENIRLNTIRKNIDKDPTLKALIDQTIAKTGEKDISKWSFSDAMRVYAYWGMSLITQEYRDKETSLETKRKQLNGLDSEGRKNQYWYEQEAASRIAPWQAKWHRALYGREKPEIDMTAEQRKKQAELYQKKINEINAWMREQLHRLHFEDRHRGGLGKQYSSVYLLHKLKKLKDPIPMIRASDHTNAYQQRLIKSVLEPLAVKCPDIELVQIKHDFSDFIVSYISKNLLPKTYFVRNNGQWSSEVIQSKHLSGPILEQSKPVTRNDFIGNGGQYWDKALRNSRIPLHTEPCTSDVFCDLDAGYYLNAIYEMDIEKIKHYENSKKNVQMGNWRAAIVDLMDDYLYLYQDHFENCIEPSAMEFTHKTTAGNFSSIVKYVVNQNLLEECNEVCGNRTRVGTVLAGETSRGIEQLMSTYSCKNPKVKQFEKNLKLVFKQFK